MKKNENYIKISAYAKQQGLDRQYIYWLLKNNRISNTYDIAGVILIHKNAKILPSKLKRGWPAGKKRGKNKAAK